MKFIKTLKDMPEDGYIFNYVYGAFMPEIHFIRVSCGKVKFTKTISTSYARDGRSYTVASPHGQRAEWDTVDRYYRDYIVDGVRLKDYNYSLSKDEILLTVLAEEI